VQVVVQIPVGADVRDLEGAIESHGGVRGLLWARIEPGGIWSNHVPGLGL
jgi:hypothetical protein